MVDDRRDNFLVHSTWKMRHSVYEKYFPLCRYKYMLLKSIKVLHESLKHFSLTFIYLLKIHCLEFNSTLFIWCLLPSKLEERRGEEEIMIQCHLTREAAPQVFSLDDLYTPLLPQWADTWAKKKERCFLPSLFVLIMGAVVIEDFCCIWISFLSRSSYFWPHAYSATVKLCFCPRYWGAARRTTNH